MDNIILEINNFRKLSGLISEQAGPIASGVRRVSSMFDNLITQGMRAGDSELDRLVRKGISNLTDDELFKLLSKLPKTEVAKILVNENIIFDAATSDAIKFAYLKRFTNKKLTWQQAIDKIKSGQRTLWNQSPNMTDDTYNELKPILDEVTEIFINNLELYVRKEGTPDVVDDLFKTFRSTFDDMLGGVSSLMKWLPTKTELIVRTYIDGARSFNSLRAEAFQILQNMSKNIADGNIPNTKKEVERLIQLAEAAKSKHTANADLILREFIKDSGLSAQDVLQYIKKDNWYEEWHKIIAEATKTSDSWYTPIVEYLNAWKGLIPMTKKDGKLIVRPEWWKRAWNMFVHASPYTNDEIIAKLSKRGVGKVAASRMAGTFISVKFIIPTILGIGAYAKRILFGEYDKEFPNLGSVIMEKIKESDANWYTLLSPFRTYIDDGISLGYTALTEDQLKLTGQQRADIETVESVLSGEPVDSEYSSDEKTRGLRDLVRDKYPDIPQQYLIRISVNEDDIPIYKQIRGENITLVPLRLEGDHIYLQNKGKNRKVRLDALWSLNEGLIKIIKEQDIDWDSGEPIDPEVVGEIPDVTTQTWSDFLSGGNSNTDGNSPSGNTPSSNDGGSFLDNILAGGGTDGGGGLFGPNNERKVTDPRYGWTIKKRSDDETMMSNYAEAIQSAINATSEDDAILDSITIEELDGGGERLVLTGQTKKGKHHLYPIEKKGSEWGWVDDADHDGNVLPDSEHKWYKFSQY